MIHVNRSGTTLGIFSEDDVQAGLRAGRFLPSDLGWREGMAQWQPLSQFSEFAADIPALGAAAAPGAPPGAPIPQTVPTVVPAPTIAARSGLPWDNRSSLGFVNAFVATFKLVLLEPANAFNVMKREGGFGDPLIYAITGGSFGLLFYFIYNFFFTSLTGLGSHRNPLAHLIGTGIGAIFCIIFIPVLIAVGVFISSAIFHLCLMIVGAAKQPFETTFRVVCFAGGSTTPLLVIPFCGALVSGIWRIVLYCIGFARAHETDTGRAVIAVLLPVVLCCGGAFVLAMALGLGAWGLSQH